jgi:hypothetical protein
MIFLRDILRGAITETRKHETGNGSDGLEMVKDTSGSIPGTARAVAFIRPNALMSALSEFYLQVHPLDSKNHFKRHYLCHGMTV